MAGKEGASARRVLLKDQQARLLVGASPELASAHERDFADGVRLLLRYGSDTSLGPNRGALWGPSAAPLAPGQGEVAALLPTWYTQANATKNKKQIMEGKVTAEAGRSAKETQREAAPVPAIDAALSLDAKAGKRKENASSTLSEPTRAAAPPLKAPKLDRQGPSLAQGRQGTSLPKEPPGQSATKSPRPGAGARATPSGARAPARKQTVDPKAGLRALLQQKKQQEAKPKPSGGGLADFLSQL
ncbi:uncharacterized protein MJAP1_000056 [Malassezia japonica]|uniref:Uncharacterized protein n=1 Tax=Malassezia japonica TaxID=223818 RepID=A0AAF0EZ52_9BASI|nr:uncharacterized protein MJAP1_000056 [Malassezia japonica]WFD37114.1 hypothetical protein MJAP1_000056 [Malassezia japonica]